tara:strand:- start:147 stop:395 length:249 start_codon:yes stop_codon:yes gene_type:complete
MKSLLLPPLAAIALPTSVIAETLYQLVNHGERERGRSSKWQIPTESKIECEKEKMRVVEKKNWHAWKDLVNQTISAICVKGK